MTCKIYAIANQKGGVGKTTTTINVASILAAKGYNVLIVDMDPQSNCSIGLGIDNLSGKSNTSYELITNNVNIEDCIIETQFPNLSIIQGSVNLAAIDVEFSNVSQREFRLKAVIRDRKDYDYILIDCPPSLGLLTINSLVAADAILMPLQCELFALDGLVNLIKTTRIIHNYWNKNLKLLGILLTMIDKRIKLCAEIEKTVRYRFQDSVFNTVIPRNASIAVAASDGKPVMFFDHKCAGAIAYSMFVHEMIQSDYKPVI